MNILLFLIHKESVRLSKYYLKEKKSRKSSNTHCSNGEGFRRSSIRKVGRDGICVTECSDGQSCAVATGSEMS